MEYFNNILIENTRYRWICNKWEGLCYEISSNGSNFRGIYSGNERNGLGYELDWYGRFYIGEYKYDFKGGFGYEETEKEIFMGVYEGN